MNAARDDTRAHPLNRSAPPRADSSVAQLAGRLADFVAAADTPVLFAVDGLSEALYAGLQLEAADGLLRRIRSIVEVRPLAAASMRLQAETMSLTLPRCLSASAEKQRQAQSRHDAARPKDRCAAKMRRKDAPTSVRACVPEANIFVPPMPPSFPFHSAWPQSATASSIRALSNEWVYWCDVILGLEGLLTGSSRDVHGTVRVALRRTLPRAQRPAVQRFDSPSVPTAD